MHSIKNENIRIVYGEEGAKSIKEKDCVVVVIDLLRASSTIINGLENGAEIYLPSLTIEDARKKLKMYPNALLAGERGGLMIPEFQLGNSPLEHISEIVKGKKIIFTSSNSTRIINIIIKKPVVILGALINLAYLKKVIYKLQKENKDQIYLIAVGKKHEVSLEDILAANIIKQSLLGKEISNINEIQDEILKSSHAKLLKHLGFEDDVKFCSQLNTHKTVPIYSNKGFIKL
jgi:2-phosphosulfolactate phosphatase